jgi:hypothetical protein
LPACRYKLSVCLDRLGSHVCAQRRVRAGICPCEHHVFALQTQNDPTIVEVSGATPSHLAEHACSATATCLHITFTFFTSLYTRTRAHTHSRLPSHTDTYSLARSLAHGSHRVTRRHRQPFTLVHNICPTNSHSFHPTKFKKNPTRFFECSKTSGGASRTVPSHRILLPHSYASNLSPIFTFSHFFSHFRRCQKLAVESRA